MGRETAVYDQQFVLHVGFRHAINISTASGCNSEKGCCCAGGDNHVQAKGGPPMRRHRARRRSRPADPLKYPNGGAGESGVLGFMLRPISLVFSLMWAVSAVLLICCLTLPAYLSLRALACPGGGVAGFGIGFIFAAVFATDVGIDARRSVGRLLGRSPLAAKSPIRGEQEVNWWVNRAVIR